jgi:hypothetical protein
MSDDLDSPSIFSDDGDSSSNMRSEPAEEGDSQRRHSGESTSTQHNLPTTFSYVSVWKYVRLTLMILVWWFGFSYLFYRYEDGWTYFEAVYFAFVTMTGIGFGDFRVVSPIPVELWWIFLFHAVGLCLCRYLLWHTQSLW